MGSIFCLLVEVFHPWLSTEHPVKTDQIVRKDMQVYQNLHWITLKKQQQKFHRINSVLSVGILTISVLWANSADDKLVIIVSYFS